MKKTMHKKASRLDVLLLVLIFLLSLDICALHYKIQKIDTFVDRVETAPAPKHHIEEPSDLLSFSVKPWGTVSGGMNLNGIVQGGYFNEGNVLINVIDPDKQVLKAGHGTATTDWMSAGPVSFVATVDFTGIRKGPAYIEIKRDNASGLPENDKSVTIPVVIQ